MQPIATDVTRLSVYLCVGHTGVLCENGWINRDVVGELTRGSKEPCVRFGLRSEESICSCEGDTLAMQPFAKLLFSSSLRQSRPNKAGLKYPSICLCVRAYVCPSTESFFDFNESWHVGRGRWVMHDGMQYNPIQGQGQCHEPFKVGNSAVFNSYPLLHLQWQLATDRRFLN